MQPASSDDESVNAPVEQRPPVPTASAAAAMEAETELVGRFEAFGQSIRLRVAVTSRPAFLSEIVPLACQIADEISAAGRHQAAKSGKPVMCREGCAACCRYLAPVSAPEARRLWAAVKALPQPQRDRVEARFTAAARAILASAARGDGAAEAGLEAISQWYWALRLECPLLENEHCVLYAERPLACREHLVTSSPRACSDFGGVTDTLSPPVSVAECMHELACRVEGEAAASLPLPLVPAWLDTQRENPKPARPAVELAGELLKLIHDQASRIAA